MQNKYTVQIYRALNKKEPFVEWLNSINDKRVLAKITRRIRRLEFGQFGDYKFLGEKLYELRFFVGPGYRVYYTVQGKRVILIIGAGDKKTQLKDIKNARKIIKRIK